MGYFRTILKSEEISRRALELTQELLESNPGCYSAWHWRRKCLAQLAGPQDWDYEFAWLNKQGLNHEKNYQFWHHRKCIVEHSQTSEHEKPFLNLILDSDSKNYHAWSYRIWLIEKFELWEGELEMTEELLGEDVRNNSVWSYRHFLVAKRKGFSEEVVEKEIRYALSMIGKVETRENEALWVYIRGFLAQSEECISFKKGLDKIFILKFPWLKSECEELLLNSKAKSSSNRFIYELLLMFAIAEQNVPEITKICSLLSSEADPIREKYWIWKKDRLLNKE